MTEKYCKGCKRTLSILSFQKRGPTKGWRALCKECDWKKYGPIKEAKRATTEGRAHLRNLRKNRTISAKKKERDRLDKARYRSQYPEKQSAKMAVRAALVSGTLVRPLKCTSCNKNPGLGRGGRSLLQAHHADYSRPLEVKWLCSVCHADEHRSLSEARPKEEGK